MVKLKTCGTDRNSYSKTDHDATFMRMKKDYMGNDQLLPAYNIQIRVADEYIAVAEVMQHRSDMDCFVPLMKNFMGYTDSIPDIRSQTPDMDLLTMIFSARSMGWKSS